MNLSRPSSFATAKAPEAYLGSSFCNVTFCEHKHATVVGSQHRLRSRHQARRGPQDCKNRARRMREANRAMVQLQRQPGKLMQAEMVSFAVASEIVCPWAQFSGSHEKLTGCGSVMDVPLSTERNSALLPLRLSPLKASGSRRLAKRHHCKFLLCVSFCAWRTMMPVPVTGGLPP